MVGSSLVENSLIGFFSSQPMSHDCYFEGHGMRYLIFGKVSLATNGKMKCFPL